ncbi:MAG: RNA polymerase sigma factor [Pseudomonadota bacterium]
MPDASGALSEAEEQRLIQRAAYSSDTKAFDTLIVPYVGQLRGYLRGLSGNDSDADDMTQTTLTKAWSQLHRFDGSGRLVAWLFRIAHREFLQNLRSTKRYSNAMTALADEPQARSAADGAAAAIDVQTILASLDPESRAALILSRAMGLTHNEISQTLDKPLGTVKSLINRATQQLVATHEHG